MAYWRSKHDGEIPPSRVNLDPISEIPRLVRNVMLIDCVDDGFRFRLVGSEIVSRAGGDGTGKPVRVAPYPQAILEPWVATMELVARTQEPQLMRLYLKGGGSMLTLILPLVGSDGSTEMLLGGAFLERNSEGFWQPEATERLDIAALSLDTADSGPPTGRESLLRSNLTVKYQT